MITMKEIGKLAGVSQSAVSMILNGKGRQFNLNAETISLVKQIALAHSYSPNLMAKGMRTGRTGIIGVLECEENLRQVRQGIGHDHTAAELQAEFLLRGYDVMIEAVSLQDFEAGKLPRLVTGGLADAIIIAGNFTGAKDQSDYFKRLSEQHARLLLIDEVDGDWIPTLTIDDREAGRQCADYLWAAGHRDFGALNCELPSAALELRTAGFCDRVRELSGGAITVPAVHAGNCWLPECGGEAVKALRKQAGRIPKALFCANDFFAYGAEFELQRMRLSIPAAVSLIAVGNWQLAKLAPVPLTTIGMPFETKFEAILKMLDQMLADRPLARRHVLLQGKLYERQSVGPAAPR